MSKHEVWILRVLWPALTPLALCCCLYRVQSPGAGAQHCQRSCNPIPLGNDPALALTSLSPLAVYGGSDLPTMWRPQSHILFFGGKLKMTTIMEHRPFSLLLSFNPYQMPLFSVISSSFIQGFLSDPPYPLQLHIDHLGIIIIIYLAVIIVGLLYQ